MEIGLVKGNWDEIRSHPPVRWTSLTFCDNRRGNRFGNEPIKHKVNFHSLQSKLWSYKKILVTTLTGTGDHMGLIYWYLDIPRIIRVI